MVHAEIAMMDILELEKILNQETGYTDLVTTEKTISDLGLDSLDTISFLFGLEQACGVKIPDEALSSGQIQTLGSLLEFVNNESKK